MRFTAMRLFLDVREDSLSMAHFFIIINENFTEYSSNVTLLCTNYINKYILTVSSKKIIENMLFLYGINLKPPLPPQGKRKLGLNKMLFLYEF